MRPQILATQDIHDAFEKGQGTKTAERVFQATLKGFAGQGLLLRKQVNVTSDVFSSLNSLSDSKLHNIFQYPLDYIGRSTRLVVYRLEGESTSKNAFALFNDTTSLYQPVTINELIKLLESSRGLEATLEDVAIRSNKALSRVLTTGRSMDAV